VPDQTLKDKTVKGIAWKAIDRFFVTGITFVFGIILARILMPSDYGLIGMLAIFFAFSQLFVESGFSKALIQKKNRTDVDYSTIFFFNLAVSLFFYVILYLSAHSIAVFFNEPRLKLITRILSLNIIINSLSLVQTTRLMIKLDFKTQAVISLISVTVSGLTAIYLAHYGFGVWALVMQNIIRTTLRTLLLFYYNKWFPLPVFSFSSFRELFGFSSKLLAAGTVAILFQNIYSLVIGKFFAAKELGYYTKAKQYPQLFSNTLTTILESVSFPVLSSLQDSPKQMISVYRRFMRVIVFFVMPSLTLFAVLAEPIIHILLTDKWLPAVPLLQWLCFARMITPISSLNMNILNAIGRSDLFLKIDIAKIPVAIIVLFITVPMGVTAIVIGNLVTTFINFFFNTYYPGKFFGFGAFKQLSEMREVALATLVMAGSVFGIMKLLPSELLHILVGVPVGMIVYLLMAHILNIKEKREITMIIVSFLKKKTV